MVQKINHKGLWSYLPILLDLFLNLSSESGKKSFILRKCDSKNFLTPCNKVHKNQIRKGQRKISHYGASMSLILEPTLFKTILRAVRTQQDLACAGKKKGGGVHSGTLDSLWWFM